MIKDLKRLAAIFFTLMSGIFLFSSCATIVGGSRYYAHVYVDDHPDAMISYHGIVKGTGSAVFKVPRLDANIFSATINEENCKEQQIIFKQRSFRGWALAATIAFWEGDINGIPLPYGIIVDLSTGALWKPSIAEKGVTKINYKHYNYLIEYTGCKQNEDDHETTIMTKAEKLSQLKSLLEDGILTQEEFDSEKEELLKQ
jgi:hypothetical protein